jgi:two-component system response regulator HydG
MAQTFLKEFAAENGKTVRNFSTEAMDAILQYQWPGNVRELRATVERAVVLCRSDTIETRDLPANVRDRQAELTAAVEETERKIVSGKLSLKEAEKQLIIHALNECSGNRTEAAKKLGISRRTLHRKLHEFGLNGQ